MSLKGGGSDGELSATAAATRSTDTRAKKATKPVSSSRSKNLLKLLVIDCVVRIAGVKGGNDEQDHD